MSRTSKRIAIIGAAVLLSPMAWQSAASAAPATVCTGELKNKTYKSVVVPEGEHCVLINVTVTGQVQARRDSTLNVDGSDIKQVHGLKAEMVRIKNSSISKHVHIQQGDVNDPTGTDIRVRDSKVGGNIHVHHNVGTIEILRSEVGGHIQLQHNRSHLVITDNTVGKNLQVMKTTTDTNASKLVTRNKVAGQLHCRHNEAPFDGSKNISASKVHGDCSLA